MNVMFANDRHFGGLQESGITVLSKTNNHKPDFFKIMLIITEGSNSSSAAYVDGFFLQFRGKLKFRT